VSKERKRIAIVDDESDLAELFSQALQSAGLKATAFDDPIAALEHVATNPQEFSMVITDWKMPKMNGIELTKKLFEIDGKIRVMLMSAYELDEEQLREVGRQEYLRKPMHIAKLIETVKTELERIGEEEEPKKQTLRKSLKMSLA
jgi:DNA-binding response OmpR family regulator